MTTPRTLIVAFFFGLSGFAGYQVGTAEAIRMEAASLKEQEKLRAQYAEQERSARLRYSEQAAADKIALNNLHINLTELNAYLEASPTGRDVCLSGADTDRLRKLW